MTRLRLEPALAALTLIATALLLPACSACRLQGVTVEGAAPAVLFVDADDPRLKGPVVGETAVTVTLDPKEMHPRNLGTRPADDQGRFSFPIDAGGAGFLEYEIQVVARKAGYQTAAAFLPLPGSGQRLLIIMAIGRDTYQAETDILQETIDIGRRLERQ
ncbi:MAG: hypothetical protein WD042_16460 [Phycisphaeraceae bacterium]